MFGAASSSSRLEFVGDNGLVLARLDTSAKEPLTNRPFCEIIESNKPLGICTLFARLESDYDSVICEAFAFNKRYLNIDTQDFDTGGIEKFLIQRARCTVRYFMLDEQTADKAYTIGSFEGMLSKPARKIFVDTVFRAHNPHLSYEQRSLNLVALGVKYARGEGVRAINGCKALYWFEKALQEEGCPRAQAQACFHLGLLYKGCGGIATDLVKARSYFEQAASQEVSVGSREFGLLQLAKLDELEGNEDRACSLYLHLQLSATYPDVKGEAQRLYTALMQRKQATQAEPYGLEDKRTEPGFYDSPLQTRHLQASYQMMRDVDKATAFIDSMKIGEGDALVDQNTPPRSNASSSSE